MCEKCEEAGVYRVELAKEIGMEVQSVNGSTYFETKKDPSVLDAVESHAQEIANATGKNVFIYLIETITDKETGEIYRRIQEAYAKISGGKIIYFAGIEEPGKKSGIDRSIGNNSDPTDYSQN